MPLMNRKQLTTVGLLVTILFTAVMLTKEEIRLPAFLQLKREPKDEVQRDIPPQKTLRRPKAGPSEYRAQDHYFKLETDAAFLALMLPHGQEATERIDQVLTVSQNGRLREQLSRISERLNADGGEVQRLLEQLPEEERTGTVAFKPTMRELAYQKVADGERMLVTDLIGHLWAEILMAREEGQRAAAGRMQLLAQSLDERRGEDIADLEELLTALGGPLFETPAVATSSPDSR